MQVSDKLVLGCGGYIGRGGKGEIRKTSRPSFCQRSVAVSWAGGYRWTGGRRILFVNRKRRSRSEVDSSAPAFTTHKEERSSMVRRHSRPGFQYRCVLCKKLIIVR